MPVLPRKKNVSPKNSAERQVCGTFWTFEQQVSHGGALKPARKKEAWSFMLPPSRYRQAPCDDKRRLHARWRVLPDVSSFI